MKNDFDFIKDKFDNDNIVAPDSIGESIILDKLEDKPRLKLYQKKSFKALVSAAACFALVIGVLSSTVPKQLSSYGTSLSKYSDITSFESYAQIKSSIDRYEKFSSLKSDYAVIKGESFGGLGGFDNNAAAIETADSSEAFVPNSETYVQVEGVDEADVIKNDGKYIYFLNSENEIMIYEGTKLVSKISDYSFEKWNENYDKPNASLVCIFDFYVKGSKLVLLTDGGNNNHRVISEDDNEEIIDCAFISSATSVVIYDLSDIKQPVKINEFSQSGSYTSSRMIDNQLYTISTKYIYDCIKEDDCYITTSDGSEETVLPASSIYCGREINEKNIITISAIDVEQSKRTVGTKAFFGCYPTVYCSKSNLYLAVGNHDKTQLIKAELGAKEISFTATGDVNGYCNNQFSMDERDGCLRVATTTEKGNNLYVLDDKLSVIGKVEGFAKNEDIKAVKFIGDMAYVITYEFTDPLFVIDLSDKYNPIIKGSVEITGFSSQLVPIDENTLLGIGTAEDFYGMKLALFDISNPSKPAVLDSRTFGSLESTAEYNHKSIIVNKEKGYFAIPFAEYFDYNVQAGAMFISVKDGKLSIDRHTSFDGDGSYECRLTYIGDTVYILGCDGEIDTVNK